VEILPEMLSDCRRSLKPSRCLSGTPQFGLRLQCQHSQQSQPRHPCYQGQNIAACNYKGVALVIPIPPTVSLTSKVTVRKTDPHRTCQRLPQDGAHSDAAPFVASDQLPSTSLVHVADYSAETTVNVTTPPLVKLWRLFRLRLPRQCMWACLC